MGGAKEEVDAALDVLDLADEHAPGGLPHPGGPVPYPGLDRARDLGVHGAVAAPDLEERFVVAPLLLRALGARPALEPDDGPELPLDLDPLGREPDLDLRVEVALVLLGQDDAHVGADRALQDLERRFYRRLRRP